MEGRRSWISVATSSPAMAAHCLCSLPIPGNWAGTPGTSRSRGVLRHRPAEVFKYKRPVLVKVLDAQWKAERNGAHGKRHERLVFPRHLGTDLGVATANLLSPEYVDRLTKIVESLPSDVTIREAMRARSAEIAKLLTDAGAIAPNRLSSTWTRRLAILKKKPKTCSRTCSPDSLSRIQQYSAAHRLQSKTN